MVGGVVKGEIMWKVRRVFVGRDGNGGKDGEGKDIGMYVLEIGRGEK